MEAWMSGRKKKGYDKSVYRSFALVMQFGINMLVPICMMSALGIYLDQKLGTSYIMVLLFFVGAIAGGQNVFRMAKKIYHTPEDEAGRKEAGKAGFNGSNAKRESISGNESHGDIEKGE